MKQILVIDESSLFREYLRQKLQENRDVEVLTAVSTLDGVSKLRNNAPDLIILDYHLKGGGYREVLREKMKNINTVKGPAVVTAQKIDQKKIIELIPFGVKKIFTKPVKIDALCATLKDILGLYYTFDKSPGIVEVHVNEDIIFVEIAQGLNGDKLDMLQFKIIELIELYDIHVPKIIVMLSDVKFSHVDAPNMLKLLKILVQATKSKSRFIKVLTMDPFAKKFIEEQEDYDHIEVVSSLEQAVEGLLTGLNKSMELEEKAKLIGDKVLAARESAVTDSMNLRFEAETKKTVDIESLKEYLPKMRIAVIDDDFVVQSLIQNTFSRIGAEVLSYSDGSEYAAVAETEHFDLVFLDIVMPKMDGFSVLDFLRTHSIDTPVIILSSITQRETVIKTFQMGIKSYLTKPLKPEAIFKKAMEILRSNF